MQHSAGPWRACGVLHCIRLGCEGLILGRYLLLYWISQTPLTDILLQNSDGRLISLPQARQPGRKILDVPEPGKCCRRISLCSAWVFEPAET